MAAQYSLFLITPVLNQSFLVRELFLHKKSNVKIWKECLSLFSFVLSKLGKQIETSP